MSSIVTYRKYVADDEKIRRYADYQERYADQMRESDRELIRLIGEKLSALPPRETPFRLLDIGCSTGNLLRHLRGHFPGVSMTGGDLATAFVDRCRADQRLSGIDFEVMDILNLPHQEPFDVIVANAVAFFFSHEEYRQAMASIHRALRPGGTYLAFELLHPFEQDLEIIETSRSNPDGLKLHFRPISQVDRWLKEAGFASTGFQPFEIPIDLERDQKYSDNADGFEDLNSYTVRTDQSKRLLFRGALYQPWCHLTATRAAD